MKYNHKLQTLKCTTMTRALERKQKLMCRCFACWSDEFGNLTILQMALWLGYAETFWKQKRKAAEARDPYGDKVG
eukprot:scaffold152889_cov14-Tisochrysis_lutea.AAC.1